MNDEMKCEGCGFNIVVDTHHSWIDKKERIYCPNCHNIIHRIIYQYPCHHMWKEMADENWECNNKYTKEQIVTYLKKMGFKTSASIKKELKRIIDERI